MIKSDLKQRVYILFISLSLALTSVQGIPDCFCPMRPAGRFGTWSGVKNIFTKAPEELLIVAIEEFIARYNALSKNENRKFKELEIPQLELISMVKQKVKMDLADFEKYELLVKKAKENQRQDPSFVDDPKIKRPDPVVDIYSQHLYKTKGTRLRLKLGSVEFVIYLVQLQKFNGNWKLKFSNKTWELFETRNIQPVFGEKRQRNKKLPVFTLSPEKHIFTDHVVSHFAGTQIGYDVCIYFQIFVNKMLRFYFEDFKYRKTDKILLNLRHKEYGPILQRSLSLLLYDPAEKSKCVAHNLVHYENGQSRLAELSVDQLSLLRREGDQAKELANHKASMQLTLKKVRDNLQKLIDIDVDLVAEVIKEKKERRAAQWRAQSKVIRDNFSRKPPAEADQKKPADPKKTVGEPPKKQASDATRTGGLSGINAEKQKSGALNSQGPGNLQPRTKDLPPIDEKDKKKTTSSRPTTLTFDRTGQRNTQKESQDSKPGATGQQVAKKGNTRVTDESKKTQTGRLANNQPSSSLEKPSSTLSPSKGTGVPKNSNPTGKNAVSKFAKKNEPPNLRLPSESPENLKKYDDLFNKMKLLVETHKGELPQKMFARKQKNLQPETSESFSSKLLTKLKNAKDYFRENEYYKQVQASLDEDLSGDAPKMFVSQDELNELLGLEDDPAEKLRSVAEFAQSTNKYLTQIFGPPSNALDSEKPQSSKIEPGQEADELDGLENGEEDLPGRSPEKKIGPKTATKIETKAILSTEAQREIDQGGSWFEESALNLLAFIPNEQPAQLRENEQPVTHPSELDSSFEAPLKIIPQQKNTVQTLRVPGKRETPVSPGSRAKLEKIELDVSVELVKSRVEDGFLYQTTNAKKNTQAVQTSIDVDENVSRLIASGTQVTLINEIVTSLIDNAINELAEKPAFSLEELDASKRQINEMIHLVQEEYGQKLNFSPVQPREEDAPLVSKEGLYRVKSSPNIAHEPDEEADVPKVGKVLTKTQLLPGKREQKGEKPRVVLDPKKITFANRPANLDSRKDQPLNLGEVEPKGRELNPTLNKDPRPGQEGNELAKYLPPDLTAQNLVKILRKKKPQVELVPEKIIEQGRPGNFEQANFKKQKGTNDPNGGKTLAELFMDRQSKNPLKTKPAQKQPSGKAGTLEPKIDEEANFQSNLKFLIADSIIDANPQNNLISAESDDCVFDSEEDTELNFESFGNKDSQGTGRFISSPAAAQAGRKARLLSQLYSQLAEIELADGQRVRFYKNYRLRFSSPELQETLLRRLFSDFDYMTVVIENEEVTINNIVVLQHSFYYVVEGEVKRKVWTEISQVPALDHEALVSTDDLVRKHKGLLSYNTSDYLELSFLNAMRELPSEEDLSELRRRLLI